MTRLPRGVNEEEYYSSRRGNCCLIGISHNKVEPSELCNFISSGINMKNPTAVCIESPDGLIKSTEHEGAKMYCDKPEHRAKLLAIDTKSFQVDDGEYMRKIREQASDIDVMKGESMSRKKAKLDREDPEFAEFTKERDQMMCMEIFNAMESGYRNVVAIVGTFHVSGIKEQMGILEKKYDY